MSKHEAGAQRITSAWEGRSGSLENGDIACPITMLHSLIPAMMLEGNMGQVNFHILRNLHMLRNPRFGAQSSFL